MSSNSVDTFIFRALSLGFACLGTIAFAACSSPLAGQQPSVASPTQEFSGDPHAAGSDTTVFVGSEEGKIYRYDLSGRLVGTIRIPKARNFYTIAFDPRGNLYADVTVRRGSMLVKYAPPYNGPPIYGITDTCLAPIFATSAVVFKGSCNFTDFTALNARNGSVIGTLKLRNNIDGGTGTDSGGTDSFGNFFTYAGGKNTAQIVEYVPPSRSHSFAPLHISEPALFTDGASTIFASAQTGLKVYHSVGRGVSPQYQYLIKEPLLPGQGSAGRYAVAPNGVLFAAPFQVIPGCGGLISSWAVSVYRPGSTAPFETISPPKNSTCFGGGAALMAADRLGDLFVVSHSYQLFYYPFGSTVPAWSKQLDSDPGGALAVQ